MKKIIVITLLISMFFTTSVFASDLYVITASAFGATKKENFDLMSQLVADKDKEALKKMYDAGLIFALKVGMEVYRQDGTIWGAVQLRPKVETFTFWTFKEVIKKK